METKPGPQPAVKPASLGSGMKGAVALVGQAQVAAVPCDKLCRVPLEPGSGPSL